MSESAPRRREVWIRQLSGDWYDVVVDGRDVVVKTQDLYLASEFCKLTQTFWDRIHDVEVLLAKYDEPIILLTDEIKDVRQACG